MSLFHLPSVLRDQASDDGAGGGIGNPLSPAMRSELGKQFNGWLRREGQDYFKEMIANVMKEQMPTMAETIMENLAQQLPDEEPGQQFGTLRPQQGFGQQGFGPQQGFGQQGMPPLTEEDLQTLAEMGYDPDTDAFYTPEGYPYDPETGQVFAGPEGYDEGGSDPQTNAEIWELQRRVAQYEQQLQELNQRYEQAELQAEEADRESRISQLMSDVPWANQKAAAQFKQYINQQVWRLDDGTLVAGDRKNPLPVDKFIESEIQSSPHLLAQRNMGGSGAFSKPGMKVGGATFDQIKPFQPKEERDAVISAAVAAYQGAVQGTGTV